jgi:hypothetical protein
MKDVARISFESGGLIIPVHTPYARQTVFEHVEAPLLSGTALSGSISIAEIRLPLDARWQAERHG